MKSNKTTTEFNKYLDSLNKNSELKNYQQIVGFYFWFQDLDKKYERFSRHIKVARKIDEWAKGKLSKALKLIFEVGSYFNSRSLNWTLDTVFRNIPKYEKGDLDDHEYKEILEGEKEVEFSSKKRLAEFRSEQEREKLKKKKGK